MVPSWANALMNNKKQRTPSGYVKRHYPERDSVEDTAMSHSSRSSLRDSSHMASLGNRPPEDSPRGRSLTVWPQTSAPRTGPHQLDICLTCFSTRCESTATSASHTSPYQLDIHPTGFSTRHKPNAHTLQSQSELTFDWF